ncbi:MAG: D-sedoheptulose 7-phosphate isomerase [Chloroflexi bacterium]|nr:D-sedoheptulose 7-phosphate isomerase [Chloroflexota bacterium]
MDRAGDGYAAAVREQIEASATLKRALLDQTDIILQIANQLVEAFRRGNKVLLFGNGGSAADAQHIAAEMAGKLYFDREPLPAIALTVNTSSLTAIANDYDYQQVFARQLKGLATKGDVAVGISTSGNSRNVIAAVEEAKRGGLVTVAFVGQGGRLSQIADYVLSVPSSDTPRVQEAHITAGHIICYLVERELFGGCQASSSPGPK